jgi:hypothetical protein
MVGEDEDDMEVYIKEIEVINYDMLTRRGKISTRKKKKIQ